MDVNSGRIRPTDRPTDNEIEVDMRLATERQKMERQVSVHDHRSPLGKQLTEERKRRGASDAIIQRGLTRRQYRTLRKKRLLR